MRCAECRKDERDLPESLARLLGWHKVEWGREASAWFCSLRCIALFAVDAVSRRG